MKKIRKTSLLVLAALSLFLSSCVVAPVPYGDPYGGGPAVGAYPYYGIYGALPVGFYGDAYWYGGRYYCGGRYYGGRFYHNGQYYSGRYYHNGHYFYGGNHSFHGGYHHH